MIAVAKGPQDDADWADLATACDGNPLHWGAVTSADHMGTPIIHLVFEDSKATASSPAACALAYAPARRRWRILPNGRDLELPTPPAISPTWQNPNEKRSIYDALIAFARKAGYHQLIVHPRFGDDLEDIPHLSRFRIGATIEFVVDLDRDWEAVRMGMHRFHRKNIRRAERGGIEVVSDPSLSGLLRLRELQFSSADRSAKRGGGFGVRGKAYFERVHKLVYGRGLGDVLFARSGGEVLAGLAFVAAGRKGITVRSGSTPEGYEQCAMYILQDAVLKVAHDRGLRELNLGGVPADAKEAGHIQHGLYEFKRGFGGVEHLRRGLVIPLDQPQSPGQVEGL